MSDRKLGPDEPLAPDDPALPPDVWDSLFWACVLPSEADGPLALPPATRHRALAPADDEAHPPAAEHVPIVVAAQPVSLAAPLRPRWRERARGLRSSAALRAAVVTLVLGSAVLIATVSDGDSPRSDMVRSGPPATVTPAEPGPPATTAQMPLLEEATDSAAPASTSTTSVTPTTAPEETVTTAPQAPAPTTQTRTSRPVATTARARQAPPPTTARPTGPVCGFSPGSTVEVNLNGKPLGNYKADEEGCVQVPVTG